MGTAQVKKPAGIGDDAVSTKTGKNWNQWCAILDKAGARKMDHKTIARYLYEKQGVPGWWAQMVTVGYEQARGLRARHQKPSGYEISRSKTLPLAAAKIFAAWNDEKTRRRWLKDSAITIRKATPSKSLRITWVDGESNLDVMIYPKGKGKSQVAVQHGKLSGAKQAARMKAYWSEQLDRLEKVMAAPSSN
jgi:hypothetical protein